MTPARVRGLLLAITALLAALVFLAWSQPWFSLELTASSGDPAAGWAWRPLPEPDLAGLGSRARKWELSRYRAYQERLAGHDITETFTWCAEFLTLAASLAGDTGLRRSRTTGHAHLPGA